MTPEEFVKACYHEKEGFLKEYLSENSNAEVSQLIKSLTLTPRQNKIIGKVLDTALSDVFYNLLLGLDGSASIGGTQEPYDLKDIKGNLLSGELESFAYNYFKS